MDTAPPENPQCAAVDTGILDSLFFSIAVLNEKGVIVFANAAWRRLLGSEDPVGLNYLRHCAEIPGQPRGTDALAACAGIRSVLSGAAPDYRLEYACRGTDTHCWCRIHVTPLLKACNCVIIAHEDVTTCRIAETRLRHLSEAVEQNPASIVITDPTGDIQYVNPQFERASGYSAAEVIGQNPRLLQGGKKSPAEYRAMWDTLASGHTWRGEFENKRKDGTHYWELASISPIFSDEGILTGYVAVKEDITERKRAEKRMREAMVVFDTVQTAILTTDVTGNITAVNPAFTEITGYTPDEVLGRNPSLLKSGRHDAAYYRQMWKTLDETGHWESEVWNRRKNGEVYPEWQSITVVRDNEGQIAGYIAVFSDITERKRQEEIIWRQANFDPLTGLANRTLLRDRLERALAHAKRSGKKVGLLFLDLDGFKEINDTLGHDIGDELLVDVSLRLKACVREEDTVARLGGDEFTLVVHELSGNEDLRAIGDKVVNVLQAPFTLAGNEYRMSGSVGITVFPEDGEDVSTLLKNADIAMYRSKNRGKNRATFYSGDA